MSYALRLADAPEGLDVAGHEVLLNAVARALDCDLNS